MEAERLARLGLTVQEGAAGPEVVLPLPVDPPELVGLPPLSVDSVTEAPELEERLLAGFDAHVAQLQTMASMLESLGLSPCVEPGSLEVRAEAEVGGLRVLLGGDKQGRFRIKEVRRAGTLLRSEVGAPFLPGQFADAAAFQAHLSSMVGEPPLR